MPRVFISHAAADRAFVEAEVVPVLRLHGVETWYAPLDVPGASEWQDSIQRGLEACDWFLVVLTPRACASDWVKTELHWALDERRGRIVPVLAEDCDWKGLHLKLRMLQVVDFRQDRQAARRQLLSSWGLPLEAAPPAASAPPRERHRPGEILTLPVANLALKFAWVPPGSVLMGGLSRDHEQPVHRVTITRGFYLGIFPVTQAQWDAVLGYNFSHFRGGDRPAEMLSWYDAQVFCTKLAALTDRPIRLPTEAEWEYACRAGTETGYWNGEGEAALTVVGWFASNSDKQTQPGGKLAGNPWGLFDLHGNVWEWCADALRPYPAEDEVDPVGPIPTESCVLRGGSWFSEAEFCRSAYRGQDSPLTRDNRTGLRVCFNPD